MVIFFLFSSTLYASGTGVGRALFIEGIEYNKRWSDFSTNESYNQQMLFQILSESSHGRFLIKNAMKKAKKSGFTLEEIITSSKGSLTDTTLIRRFSKLNPEVVTYETKAKIFINRDLKVSDAVLDLAHELTHFSMRDAFNPYEDHFNFPYFVKSTIEHRGGEVDAFLSECRVMKEVFSTLVYRQSKCVEIEDRDSGKLSRRLGILKFYQIGSFYRSFIEDSEGFGFSKKEFPHLNSNLSLFISSAYSLPYPVASLSEYREVMKRVCQNDERRLILMKDRSRRVPASELSYKKMEKSFFDRCGNLSY